MVCAASAVRKEAKNSRFRLKGKRTNYPFAFGPSVCRPLGGKPRLLYGATSLRLRAISRFLCAEPDKKGAFV